jgi:4-aminobutyrate aminotransferase-like enzyme
MRSLDFHQSPDHFAVKLMETLCEAGFLTLPKGSSGKILGLTPPLIATGQDFGKVLKALGKILGEAYFS